MKKVIALLARNHGLNALEWLLKSRELEIIALATHRRLPMVEDPARSVRAEFVTYKHLAAKARIPLFTVDSQMEQEQLGQVVEGLVFDVIASVSWRRLIPSTWIAKATYGGINLHRGRLPDYRGAEPIRQALLKSERTIVVSAHRLTEVIDGGEVLCQAEYAIRPELHLLPLEEKIARIKHEITPYFGPLLTSCITHLSRPCPSTIGLGTMVST